MRKASGWAFRLNQQLRYSRSAYFVTWTYSDEYLPVNPIDLKEIKHEIQCLFKLIRKASNERKPKMKLSYYFTAERGGETNRLHFHAIIFNLPDDYEKILSETWKKGFIQVEPPRGGAINYVTGYLQDEEKDTLFNLISKGLGITYMENEKFHYQNQAYFVKNDEVKINMPRYYKDKIFTDYEKRKNALRVSDIKLLSDIELETKHANDGDNHFVSELTLKQRLNERSRKFKLKKL